MLMASILTKKADGYGIYSRPSPEWAVMSHGRNVKSLFGGFHVVPVEWVTKTLFCYDFNLSDWTHSRCVSAIVAHDVR